MKYCSNCHIIVNENSCPGCHSAALRLPCDDDFCLLLEKQAPWDEAFCEILNDHGIPHFTEEATGAWMVSRLGINFARYQIFVPYGMLDEAQALAEAFFSARYEPEDGECV